MKSLTVLASLLFLPSVAFAQVPGAIGAGDNFGPNGFAAQQAAQSAAFLAEMAAAQRQRMIATSHIRYMSQLENLRSRYAAGAHDHPTLTTEQAYTLDAQLRNQMALSKLRVQGVTDGPTLIAALAIPLNPAAELHRTAMLQAAAAQTSQQQPATPMAADDTTSGPGAMPPILMRPTFGNIFTVDKPKFSVKAGKVVFGTKVRLRSDTHYATLYYTTDGWTPTTLSAKYTGPIMIDRDTHLTVIAVGPNLLRSDVERAEYTVDGSSVPAHEPQVIVPDDEILHAGTPLRLAFLSDITSETAMVGDEIKLATDQDIELGGKVLVPKGTRVNAALTIADEQHGSQPGDLVFEVYSLEWKGKRIPLYGGETLEAEKHDNAIITAGMKATVFVAADTSLKP